MHDRRHRVRISHTMALFGPWMNNNHARASTLCFYLLPEDDMQTLNLSSNPSPAIQFLNQLIRASGGLNPTIYANTNPVDLIQRVVSSVPTVGRSEQQSNGMFLLDLGGLRFHWAACHDTLGSCLIFFVTHYAEFNGAEIMLRFLDELKFGSVRGGFEHGVLSGPMYEAEPSICRVLAQGDVV